MGAWPKHMMIHVITEAIVLIGAIMWMNNKIVKVQADLKQMESRLAQSEEMTKRCMMMIQQLYATIQGGAGVGVGGARKVVQPTATPIQVAQQPSMMLDDQAAQAAAQAQLFQLQAQAQVQQQMQAAQQAQALALAQAQAAQAQVQSSPQPFLKPTTGPNMMESILTILPSMMGPLMSGPSSSSMIIAELEKIPQPQQQAAQVEIADDDDPDVNDALQSISKENN